MEYGTQDVPGMACDGTNAPGSSAQLLGGSGELGAAAARPAPGVMPRSMSHHVGTDSVVGW